VNKQRGAQNKYQTNTQVHPRVLFIRNEVF